MDTPQQVQPLFLAADLPGIFLPQAFRLQPADKNLIPASKTGPPPDTGNPPKEKVSGISLRGNPLVDALPFLNHTWSGPGFNQIFRPQSEKTPIPGQPESDNILELNLTQEIWTFSKDLGDIPNRGSGQQRDVNLDGVVSLNCLVRLRIVIVISCLRHTSSRSSIQLAHSVVA